MRGKRKGSRHFQRMAGVLYEYRHVGRIEVNKLLCGRISFSD
jgi:hypothetical protein